MGDSAFSKYRPPIYFLNIILYVIKMTFCVLKFMFCVLSISFYVLTVLFRSHPFSAVLFRSLPFSSVLFRSHLFSAILFRFHAFYSVLCFMFSKFLVPRSSKYMVHSKFIFKLYNQKSLQKFYKVFLLIITYLIKKKC